MSGPEKPKTKLIDCWDLFLRDFHEGDEVVIICGDDEFYWGRLIFPTDELEKDHGFYLKDIRGRTRAFAWDEIGFMAHDGFPVSRLKGADGSASVFDSSHRSALRQMAGIFLDDLSGDNHFESVSEIIDEREAERLAEEAMAKRRRSMTIGDPYLIENVAVVPRLVYHRDYEEQYGWRERCLVLRADDGAVGMLYWWNNYDGMCVDIVDYEKVA